jgi:membrane-bound ClpP family serine protease
MGTATVVFLVIGGAGLLLFLLSLLGVELFDVDVLPPTEVVAAALGMFGFSAAIASTMLDPRTAPVLLLVVAIGVVVAIPSAWIAYLLARAAHKMPTDATPTSDDLLGLVATVVSPIPADGYGEVRTTLAGQPLKLNATAETPLPLGAEVFIIGVRSETSVMVEPVTRNRPA